MSDIDALIREVRAELYQSEYIWNPNIVPDRVPEELCFPLAPGVFATIDFSSGTECFFIHPYHHTVGEIEADTDLVETFFEETLLNVLPVKELHTNDDCVSFDATTHLTHMYVPYDAVDEITETVAVQTAWGDTPITVNVHPNVDNKEDYAINVAKTVLAVNTKEGLEMVAGERPHNTSGYTVSDVQE